MNKVQDLKGYHDMEGRPIALWKLCRTEPEWAVNRIVSMQARIELLEKVVVAAKNWKQELETAPNIATVDRAEGKLYAALAALKEQA